MASLREDGSKQVVIASTALSMGVNFPDIRYVINWGPQEPGSRQSRQRWHIVTCCCILSWTSAFTL